MGCESQPSDSGIQGPAVPAVVALRARDPLQRWGPAPGEGARGASREPRPLLWELDPHTMLKLGPTCSSYCGIGEEAWVSQVDVQHRHPSAVEARPRTSRVFMKSLAVWVCLLCLWPCCAEWQVESAEKHQRTQWHLLPPNAGFSASVHTHPRSTLLADTLWLPGRDTREVTASRHLSLCL